MDKGELVEAFHQEMRDLAQAHAEMMDAAIPLVDADILPDEVDADVSEAALNFRQVQSSYFFKANDLSKRFEAAAIGDWNYHMEISGARKIIDDTLGLTP